MSLRTGTGSCAGSTYYRLAQVQVEAQLEVVSGAAAVAIAVAPGPLKSRHRDLC